MADIKGTGGWSLNPDDNATIDSRIDWREGMMPSSVNDSARMMMTRIREQYDINQANFQNLKVRSGLNIKNIISPKLNITEDGIVQLNDSSFILNDEEYKQYRNNELLLNIINVRFDTRSAIGKPKGAVLYLKNNVPGEKINFIYMLFDIDGESTYVVNPFSLNNKSLLLSSSNNDSSYNLNTIQLERSFIHNKNLSLPYGAPEPNLTLTMQSYWISQDLCVVNFSILTVKTFSIWEVKLPYENIKFMRSGDFKSRTAVYENNTKDGINFNAFFYYFNNGYESYLASGNFQVILKANNETREMFPMRVSPGENGEFKYPLAHPITF